MGSGSQGCACSGSGSCKCNREPGRSDLAHESRDARALLAILNPRRIVEFEKSLDALPVSKCRIRGYTEKEIEQGIWQQVLDGAEERGYTHISLISDDLIVTPRALELVLAHALPRPERVTSGWCNVDETSPDSTVVTDPLKDPEPTATSYQFAPWWTVLEGDRIQRSYFTGFTLTTLTLHLWKQFPYMTFGEGWAADYHMSRRLYSKGIVIDTVKDAFCHHLKTHRGKPEMIKERQVRFSKRTVREVVFEEA